jgi:hypothetical protein
VRQKSEQQRNLSALYSFIHEGVSPYWQSVLQIFQPLVITGELIGASSLPKNVRKISTKVVKLATGYIRWVHHTSTEFSTILSRQAPKLQDPHVLEFGFHVHYRRKPHSGPLREIHIYVFQLHTLPKSVRSTRNPSIYLSIHVLVTSASTL